jgi:hypothetical protein
MKILPVGADLFHAERQMDRHDEASSRFSNFTNAPKIRTALRCSEQKTRALRHSGTRTMKKSYRAFCLLVTVAPLPV